MKTSKNGTPIAPAGYRELNDGEVIKDGDIRIAGDAVYSIDIGVGESYNPIGMWQGRYRKIEETATVKSMTINECYTQMQEACGIEVGDTVKVLRTAKDYEMGWGTVWVRTMDGFVGKQFVVNDVGAARGFRVTADDGDNYWLPFFILQLVSKKKAVVKVVLNGSHTAECSKDGIKVGCQDFSWDIVKKLQDAKKQLDK